MESQDEKTLIKKKGRRVRCGVELSVKEFNQGSGPSGERAGQERKNTIHKKRERGEREGEKKEKKKGFTQAHNSTYSSHQVQQQQVKGKRN